MHTHAHVHARRGLETGKCGSRNPVLMARVACSLTRAVLDLRETPVMVVYLDRRWVQWC